MLTWLIGRRLDAFEREWGYDAAYMRMVLQADRAGFLKFARGTAFAQHRAPEAPKAAWYAAKLSAVMFEDCGPCAQLAVTMAERGGVATETLRALIEGDGARIDPAAALGFEFAQAVLRRDDERADQLREEIKRRWGERALVSISLALTGVRMFPTLKRALGHGRECRRLIVAGEAVIVGRGLKAVAA